MTINEITAARRRVLELVEQSRLSEAFAAIEPLLAAANQWRLRDQVEQLQMSYNFMLQYLSQGIADPQRHDVLRHITGSLCAIADECMVTLLEPQSPWVFYARRRELGGTPLDELVSRYRAELNKVALLGSVDQEQRDEVALANVLQQSERCETDIFNKIWCTYPTPADDATLVATLIGDDTLPEAARCLFTSALLMGLLCFYDERKLITLADAYTTSTSAQVQLRALIGVLLALKLHGHRIELAPMVHSHLQAMTHNPSIDSDLAMTQFLLARSRNTENITRRVQQDLMPGIMKMRPDMLKKLREQDADAIDLEANPEWQQMLEDSGMARKMEELNKLQLEGSDVFITTFAHLKSFPFFQTLSNWFLPFHSGHSAVVSALSGDEAPLRQLVERAPMLCNSDRYSFALSLASVPPSQRQMMIGQIKGHIGELNEMEAAELPNPQQQREQLANMYVQDLYRFFRLFSRRREFLPAYDGDMDFTGVPCLGKRARSHDSLRLLAEFYFKNAFHDDAIKYYGYLLTSNDNVDPHIFQKLGFCYQSKGDAAEALRQYARYELADDADVWTIKHMATCHRELKDYDNALACYRRADALQPGNVATTLSMGHCLLEQGKPDEAMQLYFKADLAEEGSARHRAWRPVAWCSFVLGNDERSLDYYDRIISHGTPTAQDHLNRGHVLLAMHRVADALQSYRAALDADGNDIAKLREAITADLPTLTARGIDPADMPLLLDTLQL